MTDTNSKALVLFSGGQDSALCLFWALQTFSYVETVGFDYKQRHKIELSVREDFIERIRSSFPNLASKLGSDHLLDAGVLTALGKTAMTHDIAVQTQENGLPNTFVPGRNLLFFTLSGSLAYRRGLRHIIGGMCETDYSGYPDCRDDTLKSQQITLTLGLDQRTTIHTPLMWKTKAETFKMAHDLGSATLLEIIIENTHTCYLGDRTKRHVWGYGCSECPACKLRAQGWKEYCEL